MQVRVRLFALAKERAGRQALVLDCPERVTVAQLKEAIGEACPALRPLLGNLRIAIESDFAADDDVIAPGAEVAAIPPVSGGGLADESPPRAGGLRQ